MNAPWISCPHCDCGVATVPTTGGAHFACIKCGERSCCSTCGVHHTDLVQTDVDQGGNPVLACPAHLDLELALAADAREMARAS